MPVHFCLYNYDMPTTVTSLDLVFIQRGHRDSQDGGCGYSHDDEEAT